jgi:competence protein ComEC
MKKFRIYLLIFLLFSNVIIFYVLHNQNDKSLTVAFLDVGQGDAIFIRTPSGKQMLVDGGPSGGVVLRELGKVMPFYDRSIDIVVATHPDQDHIGGLNDVLERFSVDLFVQTMTTSTTAVFQTLIKTLENKKIKQEIIKLPEEIDFGDGAKFYIIFPDKDTSGWKTNDSSIVGKLIYGEDSFLLTGDSPISIENYLIKKYGSSLQSDVLKVGHHGSKYSSSNLFIQTVLPTYSIISAGLDNRYGHPNMEILDILEKFSSKILKTIGNGEIMFKSDGKGIMPML